MPINLTFSRSARSGRRLGHRHGSVRHRGGSRAKAGYRPFHARQRPRSGRGAGPPRAGRHPHGLVQGRRRGRDAGQVGPCPFPRTSAVQGHRQASDGRVLANGGLRRRPGKRLHHPGLHRLLPAGVARASQDADGIRVRPHDRPGADRCGGGARTQGRPRGAEPARRQQSARAALRADRCRALPQSSLRQAGDRLAARDRKAQPRGCAGLLQAVLHAQQRGAGGRRRRHAPTKSGRWPKRPTARSPRSPRSARALRPQEPAQVARPPRHAGRRAGPAAEPASRLSRAVVDDRQARRIRGAGSAVVHPRPRHHQPALPHARGRARDSRSAPAAGTTAPRSTPRSSASTARRSRASRCRSSRTPSTP